MLSGRRALFRSDWLSLPRSDLLTVGMPAHPAWRRNVQRSLRGPSATWPKASCGSNPGVFSLRAWLTKAVLRLLYSPYVYTHTFLVSTPPLWGQRPETISSPTPKNHASSNSLARSPVALRNPLYGQPNTGTHVPGDARCVTVLRRSCRAQRTLHRRLRRRYCAVQIHASSVARTPCRTVSPGTSVNKGKSNSVLGGCVAPRMLLLICARR